MEYDFYRFGHGDFEALVQALFQNLLGNSSIVYGLGPDGGRELSFQGKASFASPLDTHDGLWIVQAKFRARDIHDHDQYTWVKTQFQAEMRKFRTGKYPVPDQYIFVTNAVLTPVYERGGRDKMEKLAALYKALIPRIYIVAYDELCKLLLNNLAVRQAFDHLLQPGDLVAEVRQLLRQQGLSRDFVLAGREVREIPSQHKYTVTLPPDPLLTIDFGTSFSLCGAMTQRQQVELVPVNGGSSLLHSVITFFENGSYIVGNPTLRYVRSGQLVTISQVKRDLGTGRHYQVFNQTYSPEQLATLIVKSLKTSAEEYFGYSFQQVVIAKPANFNLRQTRALREVFENAGLKVRRIVDEGTAPCYLFPQVLPMTSLDDPKQILVIDLGGGTFDLSLQEIGDGIYETKAIIGNNLLGGLDFDLAVLRLAEKRLKAKHPELTDFDFQFYLQEAERVKKTLGAVERATFLIADYDMGDGNFRDFSCEFSRDDFRDCTSTLNINVMRCLNDIVRAGADVNKGRDGLNRIDAIMLTGQGAKIFTVRELIDDLYPGILVIDRFVENAVCMGNAFQAGVLQGIIKDGLLLSVQNTGLAIKARQAFMEDKIKKCMVAPVAPLPSLNTLFCTLFPENTLTPCLANFELKVRVTDARQRMMELPLFEITGKSTNYEEIDSLQIPVVQGDNEIHLKADIDANHQIHITIENTSNHFMQRYPVG